jgi:HKD family nuclease
MNTEREIHLKSTLLPSARLLIHNYENEIKSLASTATEIKVMVAFLTNGGLNWLPKGSLEHSDFIVGIGLRITTPEALKSLQDKGATVRIFDETGKLFHPKAIYLRTDSNEVLIVGSNNLTSGGIASNHEMSLAIFRNEENDEVFKDFLSYFSSLKMHERCGIPGPDFYDDYKPSSLRKQLMNTLSEQQPMSVGLPCVESANIQQDRIHSLGDFIRLIAQEFPKLDRRNHLSVKDHPLKRLNDDEFLPLFQDIVSVISHGRMKGHSQLTIGGQWYRIPNILSVDGNREPWENTRSKGRLVLQIHFSQGYERVLFSVVLQYNLHRSVDADNMQPLTRERYQKLLGHLENASSRANLDSPVFRHWNYKDEVLWGKPLLSFEYQVGALPSNEHLVKDLEFLSGIVNGASCI